MKTPNMKSPLLIFCISGIAATRFDPAWSSSALVWSKNVTKRKGETLVLNVDDSQTLEDYLWTYGRDAPTRALAVVTNRVLTVVNGTRFGSRLHVDSSSGSLTISNLTIRDTGTFLMQILTKTGTVLRHFTLTVIGNTVIIRAVEGSNVTLPTIVQQLDPKHHHLFWTLDTFEGKRIVTWENNTVTYDPDWRDRVVLHPQTGSLTIINITKQLSGSYCVSLMYGHELHSNINYQVHVYCKVSVPHLSTEEHILSPGPWSCRVNCSVLKSDNVSLTWFRDTVLLNQSSDANVSSQLVLTLDVPLSSREHTYRCVAANPVSKRAAVLNMTYWCPEHVKDSTWKIGLGVGFVFFCIILIVILTTAGIKRHQCQRPTDCINLGTTDSTTQAPECDSLIRATNAANSRGE